MWNLNPRSLVRATAVLLACLMAVFALAAPEYAKWTAELLPKAPGPDRAAEVVVRVSLADTWHLYSMTTPEGGPIRTEIGLEDHPVVKLDGKVRQGAFTRKIDEAFGIEVESYAGAAEFRVPVRVEPGATGEQTFEVRVRYQMCSGTNCLRPTTIRLPVTFTVGTEGTPPQRGEPGVETIGGTTAPAEPAAKGADSAGQAPGGDAFSKQVDQAKEQGLLRFVLLAMGLGFLSLLTPCVFPMIPITVSYFSKQKSGLKGPLAYSLGIVLTFTGLGVFIAAFFKAAGIQQFAANFYLNVFLAVLFFVLALNLFGVFEIKVPTSLATKLQTGGRERGGFLGPILMAVAFTIISFTCTSPFVGTVLVGASQGDFLYPIVGMLAFSTAFASPFFFLALFPGYLAKMPKSGGWLASLKVTMGFLEIAAAVKFLSNADLVRQWGLLTRPVFLALWAAIAVVTALYLFGWFRLPHEEAAKVGWARRILAFGFAAVSVWFLGGVNGRPLGELDAFLPPVPYPGQAQAAGERVVWMTKWEEAQAKSRETGKPIFVDFTGVTCTNCRWMEKNMFPRDEIVQELEQFVVVKLYTDRDTPEDNANAKLQDQMTGVATLPVYVVATPDGKPHKVFQGMTRDPKEFAGFLSGGRALVPAP